MALNTPHSLLELFKLLGMKDASCKDYILKGFFVLLLSE
jgi:hypothetical protein